MNNDMRKCKSQLKYYVGVMASGWVLLISTGQAATGQVVGFDPADNPIISGLRSKDAPDLQTALGLGTVSPAAVALSLINIALSLLGTVSLVLLIYGGFLWVWARGNSEEVDKAKEIIKGTIIGLIIVFASLGITQYVFFTVGNITGATTADSTTTVTPDTHPTDPTLTDAP